MAVPAAKTKSTFAAFIRLLIRNYPLICFILLIFLSVVGALLSRQVSSLPHSPSSIAHGCFVERSASNPLWAHSNISSVISQITCYTLKVPQGPKIKYNVPTVRTYTQKCFRSALQENYNSSFITELFSLIVHAGFF